MADALNRRDIDMIFRAETDKATRSVGDLKKSVRDLRNELTQQSAAAERGEGSLEDLARTTNKLKQAQDELGTARSLLTQLNTLTGRFEKTEARTSQLRTELAALQAQQAAAEKPTKRLANSIAAKERALSGSLEKQQRENAELTEYRSKVEAILGPVDRLEDSFREVASISKDVAQGLALSGNAVDTFADNAKRAAAAATDLDDFTKFAQGAGLLADDIAELSQYEDRIERVTAARNAQIAADLRYQDALEQAQLAQQRLAQTNAFRQTAEQAREAFRDVSRFQAETVESTGAVNRLAAAVVELADPARAAANDMSRVADTVDEVAARVEAGGRRRTGELSQDLNDLEQALAGLNRQAQQVDGLRDQQLAVERAEKAFASAKNDVFELANALDQAGGDATDEMAMSLRQAETAAERAGNAFRQESTKLKQLEAAAESAAIDVRNLDAAEKQIIATSTRAGAAAQTLRRQLGMGNAAGGGFLGLRPYELQNLSFQIQDIFVSLASGQNPLTVLAQQGSQIAQLFPGMWAAMAKGLPILGPLAIGLTAVGLGMARARQEAQKAREISAALVQMGEGTTATADQVSEAISRLDDLGASAEDAKKSILSLVREGMDPKFFDDFGAAALAFSEITGEDLPAATERLTEGLTRGKDEVLALDEEFKFLTDSEREQIRAMDDSTDAADIRTIAFDAFHRQAVATAEELRGPSRDAVETLEAAWSDFLDTLADVAGFEDVDDWLADLTNGIAVFVRFLSNAIRQLQNSFGKLAEAYRSGGVLGALGAIGDIAADERSAGELIQQSINELATERAERSARRRNRTSSGDVGAGTRGAGRTREGVLDRKQKKGGKSEAEKLAEQLAREQEQLQRALEQMTSKALSFQQQSIEQQLSNAAEIVENEYAKLYRQLDEFRAKFGADATIAGLSQAEYRAQLDANKQIITQRAQLKVYEESINDLMEERSRRLKTIAERQDAGLVSAAEALRQAEEVTSSLNPAIEKAARDARDFAVALGGAAPSPELLAFIAKLDGIGTTLSETKIDLQKQALADLAEIEKDRNDIISRRDNLIAANNELVRLGLMTESEAREQAAAAYNREREALRALIEEERQYLQIMLQRKLVSETEFQARMAQLDALAAQTEYVDDRILQINAAAEGAFTQGFSNMFNTLAEGLSMLITGGGDVGDMLENLGVAALQFAADFLKALADVMVQMLALQAFKAIFGASTGGIGALFFHGGGNTAYGGSQMTRSNFSVSPLAVAAAPRYHEGTDGAGLRRNEMLAVLERGEKVVTEEQQRLEAKRAGRGSGNTRLRQVLAFGDDEVAGAMSGSAGEEVTLTHIRRNKTRIKQELDIG